MFGFLQAPAAPCCGRTPDLWRGQFCGLATRMHHDFGSWSRFLINRDSTFLALAGFSDQEHPPRLSTCCNPLAKPKLIYDTGRHVEYAADITLCALGIKLRDDACDETWPRRLLAKIGERTLAPAVDKAVARLNTTGFPTATVAETILSQHEVEQSQPDALGAANPTAQAYGTIFEQHPGANSLQWRNIGTSLGKLIYWDDAWRDWTSDLRRKRFNPLSHTPAPELREMMAHEFQDFQNQIEALPDIPQKATLLQVATQTGSQIPQVNETPEQAEKKRRRREKRESEGRKWHDWCDCCYCDCTSCSSSARCCGGSSGKADACFDCGPGDSGCIDCCPCDGCSCS
ncbi:DUF5685 family protein [Roseibacillus persicicus]|uniref:Uncharacterized protein n=1 Tax=Roseibacillus persicicus TaxID=454148 RepID=A0A918WP76_9BACT|nr:DUF5685 family protein [Roseibacillus persicicus]GHC64640.1 hypothetical protein GCM10007100_35330 [Roseibacillus persicicus]